MPFEIIKVPLTPDIQKSLIDFLYEKFQSSLKARSNQVDNSYKKWLDNYNAKPAEEIRSTPFYNASNFIPQLIRMHTDILTARIVGILFGTKPFWKPTAILGDAPHEMLETLADVMQWVSFYDISGFQRNFTSVIKRCFKTGTVVLKYPWMKETKFKVRTSDSRGGHISEEVVKEFLDFKPIPFDDFWVYPITVMSLCDVKIKFHRIRLTKEDVKSRMSDGWWDKKAAQTLLDGGPSKVGEEPARETQAQEAAIELSSDVTQPFSVIEAWLDYDIEPGKSHSIIVCFNPQVKGPEALLKCYFNVYDEDPFADFHLMPREELFYDYCVPEILEQSQEEQAQVHNTRRDASTITNTPGWIKKRGANVPNPASSWYPNKVFEVDSMDDLQPLQLRPQYQPMMEEEQTIMQQAERYTGVTPPMQGSGTGSLSGKRGVYNTGGTLALLAEGNRRLDMYVKAVRDPAHSIGKGIFTSYRDFGETKFDRFKEKGGEKYAHIQQLLQLSKDSSHGGLFFDLAASEASVNKETDRTSLLLMANTLAAYYQRVVEMSGMVAQLPPENPVRGILLSIIDGARDLANRILYSFDVGDRGRLLPDVRKVLDPSPNGANDAAQGSGLPQPQQDLSINRLREFASNAGPLAAGNGNPTGRPS